MNLAERDAFLNAIHAAPDDDAPRLVFSDWLEENGEAERAEFIRIQIAMKQEYETHQHPTSRLDELFRKQKALFNNPWADALRRCQAAAISTYSRGFSTAPFHMSAATFAKEASELVGWFGPGPRLGLELCRGELGRVADRAELRWLSILYLRSSYPVSDLFDEDIREFCRSPFLSSLQELHLSRASGRIPHSERETLTADACRWIANAASLIGLRLLDLSGNSIGDEGVIRLAKAKQLRSLKVLILHDTEVSTPGAEALARTKNLDELTELRLTGNSIPTQVRRSLSDRFGSAVSFGPSTRRR